MLALGLISGGIYLLDQTKQKYNPNEHLWDVDFFFPESINHCDILMRTSEAAIVISKDSIHFSVYDNRAEITDRGSLAVSWFDNYGLQESIWKSLDFYQNSKCLLFFDTTLVYTASKLDLELSQINMAISFFPEWVSSLSIVIAGEVQAKEIRFNPPHAFEKRPLDDGGVEYQIRTGKEVLTLLEVVMVKEQYLSKDLYNAGAGALIGSGIGILAEAFLSMNILSEIRKNASQQKKEKSRTTNPRVILHRRRKKKSV